MIRGLKLRKHLLPLVLGLLVIAAWISLPLRSNAEKKKYAELISEAEALEERKIYTDALDRYLQALEIRGKDYRVCLKTADIYYLLGDYASFISQAGKCLEIKPSSPAVYSRLLEHYLSVGDYDAAIRTYEGALASDSVDSAVSNAGRRLMHSYSRIWLSLSDTGDFFDAEKWSTAPASVDGKWGLISSDGKRVLKYAYDAVVAPGNGEMLIPVKSDGEWFYVDGDGNRKLASLESYGYLGPFEGDIAPCERNGVYGYIDKNFTEKHMEFEYAGAFSGGCAAVEKDGKWALINRNFVSLTSFEYDRILLDRNGYATRFGIAVGEKDGSFYFIGTDGKESPFCFEDAALPASDDGMIAVKKDGLWYFTDRDGGELRGLGYAGAISFSHGLAAVNTGVGWVYIDERMEPVSEDVFTGCSPFAGRGSAFVYSGYAYNIIKLSVCG
ncbi:MAG: WG repeat-containing protein [Clostridia bacterium]|nr:WG repeat-containing protein [Clostridia bacterium]